MYCIWIRESGTMGLCKMHMFDVHIKVFEISSKQETTLIKNYYIVNIIN